MTWVLLAAGLGFVFCLVFVLALCAAAAAGDRVVERARVYPLDEARDRKDDAA